MRALDPGAAILAPILLGYVLVALTPGPNMLVVANVAAMRGLRATLPHCLGTGCGVALLAVIAFVAAVAPQPGSATDWILRGGSAVLLLRAAWQIARLAPAPEGDRGKARRVRFSSGFQIALFNPYTFGYFTAAAMAAASDQTRPAALAPWLALGAGITAALIAILVAAVFGQGAARRALQAFHQPVRLAVALLLCSAALERASILLTGA